MAVKGKEKKGSSLKVRLSVTTEAILRALAKEKDEYVSVLIRKAVEEKYGK